VTKKRYFSKWNLEDGEESSETVGSVSPLDMTIPEPSQEQKDVGVFMLFELSLLTLAKGSQTTLLREVINEYRV
jgi:hypothetical protein